MLSAMMSVMDAAAAAAAEAVMRGAAAGDVAERHERVLLRPWLENLIHSGFIPGLEWIDAGKTMFKVPWKHRSKKNWSLRHSSVFLVSHAHLLYTACILYMDVGWPGGVMVKVSALTRELAASSTAGRFTAVGGDTGQVHRTHVLLSSSS